ncbi:MAG: hypothetical protein JSS32_11015 [Verrucomicrobia bacterium]|nr:hypothetical protein [Verrucomicrobiota bacterium]
MSAAAGLHSFIDKYNILKGATEKINAYLLKHPTLYKIVLIVNHLFRALAMFALMVVVPISPFITMGICFAGSLFYRFTVENNCAYKFALPAFFGGCAAMLAKMSVVSIAAGAALASAGVWFLAAAAVVSIAAYVVYIALTVSYDVDQKVRGY